MRNSSIPKAGAIQPTHRWSRGFPLLGAMLALWLAIPSGYTGAAMPKTGKPVPSMASYDKEIEALLTKWKIPGASVAVTKDERLVFARGYGLADVDKKSPVQPDTLFRIASISKPITAVAILKLVEEKKLSLDQKAFSILTNLKPLPGKTLNPALRSITLRQLLEHTGGWDRTKSFDPMFRPITVATALKKSPPGGCEDVLRYMLHRPLDFPSGTGYAYSNFGYCILGRVIEKVTGMPYVRYVKTALLSKMGIRTMRLGATLLQGRASNETRYYHYPGGTMAQSVFSKTTKKVPWPYGGFYLEAMDAHGGWIASAIDLVRFVAHVDRRPLRRDLLRDASLQAMVARPAVSHWKNKSSYYGLGWSVRPIGNGANWWHTGGLAGTATLLVRTHHGYSWSLLCNSRPKDRSFYSEADQTMWKAFRAVRSWPTHDLFGKPPVTPEPNPEPLSEPPSEPNPEPGRKEPAPEPTPPDENQGEPPATDSAAPPERTPPPERTTPEVSRERPGNSTDRAASPPEDSTTRPPPNACGCSASAPVREAAGWLFCLLAVFVWRRRAR